MCPTCYKIDAARAFAESEVLVRQCLDCKQQGRKASSEDEAHLRQIMNSDAVQTATNARIARQRVGEIQHVITAQQEFPGFPTGSVRSNPDPASTPDCIVNTDQGEVAVEVTELLAPEAGQAHENALQIAQRSIWGAWQTREMLAGPRGRYLNITHWYFNDSLVGRIGKNPTDEERQTVQERTDEIAGAMFDGAGKVLDYLAFRKGGAGVPHLDLDSQWYDRWCGGCRGGIERFLVLNLKQVDPVEVKPPDRSPGNAYGGSTTDGGRYKSGAGFYMTLTIEAIQERIDKKAAAVQHADSSNFARWLLVMKAGDRYTAGRQNSGYKPGLQATGTQPKRGARIDCRCFESLYISTTDRQFVVHKREDGSGELREIRNGTELVPDD